MPPSRPLNQLGQLRDVVVSNLQFDRNWAFDADADAAEPGRIHYSVVTETEATTNDDRDVGFVALRASISWSSEDDESTPKPFDLDLTLQGTFDWFDPEMDREDIEAWLEFNGEHLLWPYVRNYVQTVTGWSDVPPLTIYTLGVPHPRLGREQPAASD